MEIWLQNIPKQGSLMEKKITPSNNLVPLTCGGSYGFAFAMLHLRDKTLICQTKK
jgi:hypothetical protein